LGFLNYYTGIKLKVLMGGGGGIVGVQDTQVT
jgi:hypothetical protein